MTVFFSFYKIIFALNFIDTACRELWKCMLICFTWVCNIFYSVWWSPAIFLFVYLLTNVLSISLSLLLFQQFFNTTLFYSCHFPLGACPSVCRMQNVPFFSSASSFSSSPAPLSSFPSVPPLHPAPRPLKARFTPVGEGSPLVRPTSLPPAPETGTGAGGDVSSACSLPSIHTAPAVPLLVFHPLSFHAFLLSTFFSQLPGWVNGDLPKLRPL